MKTDFLKNFPQRMEKIGAYALLFKNSMPKGTWKQYGFEDFQEQTNITFAVLLYIMEQSLKEEACTLDDIGSFIDELNLQWFKKPLSYPQCCELGNFIVNIVLCDDGRAMYFQGFDFEAGDWRSLHISFVANRTVYRDGDIRRTSYYLTDAGYNLLLSTLEIEANMRLTIQEMIFKLHLEKASYDKAVDDIKNIFNLLRIQYQKIQEAMRRIRQNALRYAVADYQQLMEENLAALEDTSRKFFNYRENIRQRVRELEEKDINIRKLKTEEAENLNNLKIIEGYLTRALDEHQKILTTHFDLKALYARELEDLAQMALIQRFNLRSELYDKVLSDANHLRNLEQFIRPLLNRELDKSYNLNKALEYQRPLRKKAAENDEAIFDFADASWQREQEARLKAKLLQYEGCLTLLLERLYQQRRFTLQELQTRLSPEDLARLIPSASIFKEVMVELIKHHRIDLPALRRERAETISDKLPSFQLNEMLLDIIDRRPEWQQLERLTVWRLDDAAAVVFPVADGAEGRRRQIRCSNLGLAVK